MKRKIFSMIFSLLLIGAIANPSLALAEEGNEPEHKISEAHEGIDSTELLAAGAGLVIAVGLAFTIGRRSRKKP
jgi:hypothetical protein